MGLTISITLLLVVSGTALLLAVQSFSARGNTLARLQRISGRAEVIRPNTETPTSFRERLSLMVSRLSGKTSSEGKESSTYANLRQQLIEAGYRRSSALSVYMGSRVAITAGAALLAFPASIFVPNPTLVLCVLVAAAGVGFIIPGMVLGARRSKRQASIVNGLPDAIDLMVVCVEAGLSLAATIDRVAKEFFNSNPILASELKLTVLETQAGKSLGEALRTLGSRNGVSDLTTLTSSLVQTERLGTRVADTLRIQAGALRTRRLQQAETVAQRAPVKMVIPAGLLIFLPAMGLLAAPAFLRTIKAIGG